MTPNRFCITGLVVYVLLSLTDFVLTSRIIQKGVGYESNPFAEAWLHRYGWAGLAVFKTLSAVAFGATVVVLSRHRPRTAGVLVTLGCVALLVVVGHSWRMLDTAEEKTPDGPARPFPIGRSLSRHIPSRPEVAFPAQPSKSTGRDARATGKDK
jgi:hypothetical protein